MMRKLKMISGLLQNSIYRHHVEPKVKLYMSKEESFPIPLKYIDVTRTTHTSLDVLLEKHIEDYWNVDGDRELSDAWTGFTRFMLLNERPPDGYTSSSGETYEETNNLKTRQCMAGYVAAHVWCSEKQSKTKVGCRETKARSCQTITRYLLQRTWGWRIQTHTQKRS